MLSAHYINVSENPLPRFSKFKILRIFSVKQTDRTALDNYPTRYKSVEGLGLWFNCLTSLLEKTLRCIIIGSS